MKNLLIVGCGRLGFKVAWELSKKGYKIWALRRTITPIERKIPWIFSWLFIDLERLENKTDLPTKITHILYCPTPEDRTESSYQKVFIQGLQKLFKVINTQFLERVVFISSSAVYEDCEGGWVDEDSHISPRLFNGKILLQSENFLDKLNVPNVSLRLSGIYGPNHLGSLERLLSNKNIFNYKNHWINKIHIDDATSAVENLLCAPVLNHSVFIATDDTPMISSEFYLYLSKMLNLSCSSCERKIPEREKTSGKRLSNKRLKRNGWILKWPKTLSGYSELIHKLRKTGKLKI